MYLRGERERGREGGREGERAKFVSSHTRTRTFIFLPILCNIFASNKEGNLAFSFHSMSVDGYIFLYVDLYYIIFQRFGTVSVSVCIQFTL